MKTITKVFAVFLVLLFVQPVFSAGNAESKSPKDDSVKVFKLANDNLADLPVGIGLTRLAEEVEKRSNGKMKIEIYFNAQLGQEPEVLDNILLGSIDMMKANAGNMAGHVQSLNAFTIPFIFADEDHAWRVFNGPVGDIVKRDAEKTGYKILTFFEEGARSICSRKGFVSTPDDMLGLKIRIMGAPSIQDGFKQLKSSPTPMAYGEVYTGLSQGVIDAAENPLSAIEGQKFYEVAPYVTETEHLRIPAVILIGMKQWNSLTEAEQQIFMDSADAAREFQRPEAVKLEKASIDQIVAKGGKFKPLTAEERSAFAEQMAPVYEKYKSILGAEVIDGILNAR